MDDIARNSPVAGIQPVRKIRARIFNRERRELLYLYERNRHGQLTKRKRPITPRKTPLAADSGTSENAEQDFIAYKSDLKIRLAFDRSQILPVEPDSD